MIANLAALLLASAALMGSPGPATLSLAAIGAAFGARQGLPYLAGIVLGTLGVLLIVASGLTAAILTVPAIANVVTFVAAAYILYLAWRIATAPPLGQNDATVRAPSLVAGFALAIANPKAYAAIGAVYSGNVLVTGDILSDAGLKIAVLAAMILTINSTWLVFGSLISRFLHDPRYSRIANITFALLLLVSVAFAVF
ncbi:MAG: LysE family translocator [Salaquimonas sp.]|nr:LysE family translocator [Salaquimonas sp.]